MVRVAIAGAGQVAREIIDGLVATGKHEVLILSRRDPEPETRIDGTAHARVDYQDKEGLVRALGGVHTVLSFITAHMDPGAAAQKALIDAAVEAGVKRFAPSEWALADIKHLDWYATKLEVRRHLEDINREGKVLEYTLFQPGWFLNYLAGNRRTATHLHAAALMFVDHENRRATVASGSLDQRITYTSVQDVVNIVVRAVGYEGEWPRIGGINGHTLSLAEEIAIGERVRGKPYDIETLDLDDLRAGVVKIQQLPSFNSPYLAGDNAEELYKGLLRGLLLNAADGGATTSDEWNRIFPDYKFTQAEEFLTRVFADKP